LLNFPLPRFLSLPLLFLICFWVSPLSTFDAAFTPPVLPTLHSPSALVRGGDDFFGSRPLFLPSVSFPPRCFFCFSLGSPTPPPFFFPPRLGVKPPPKKQNFPTGRRQVRGGFYISPFPGDGRRVFFLGGWAPAPLFFLLAKLGGRCLWYPLPPGFSFWSTSLATFPDVVGVLRGRREGSKKKTGVSRCIFPFPFGFFRSGGKFFPFFFWYTSGLRYQKTW